MAEYYIDKDGKLKKREPAKALTSAVKKASNIEIAPVGTPRSASNSIKPTSVTVAPSSTPTLSQAESEFVTRRILGSQEYQTKKDRTWFAKGYFDDGYQPWDLTKTTWATRGNIAKNVGEAIIGFGEKAVDALATLGQYMGEAELSAMPYSEKQYETYTKYKDVGRKQTSEFVAKDLYDEEKIADMLITKPFEKVTKLDTERGTFLGEKSQALVQSAAQLALQVGLNVVTKGAVPWYVTTGLNVYGGEVENALRSGATLDEASASAAISTAGEILSEKLFGMYGGKMTDLLAQNIGKALGSKLVGSLIKAGFDVGGEGAEEVLSDYVSRFGQWLTYNDEKTLLQVLNSEDAIDERIEAFVGGMFLGGGFTASNVMNTKTDYLTGNDAAVQKVIDAEVERIVAEAKKNGEKVNRTEIYNEVEDKVKRGDVTTDTIEAILGDEAYSEYKKASDTERAETERLSKEISSLEDKINSSEDVSTEDREKLSSLRSELESLENNSKVKELKKKLDALVRNKVKGTSLAESYNEIARQSEGFTAQGDDVTLNAKPESNESVEDIEDITFEETSPLADEPTLAELRAERDDIKSRAEEVARLAQETGDVTEYNKLAKRYDELNRLISEKESRQVKLDEKKLNRVANYLKKVTKSTTVSDEVKALLDEVYQDISIEEYNTEAIQEKIRNIARKIAEGVEPPKVTVQSIRDILQDLRKTTINLTKAQKNELKYKYDKDWGKKLYGRFKLSKDTKYSLESQWKDLAELYPEYFDANTPAVEMGVKLIETYEKLKSLEFTIDDVDIEDITDWISDEILSSYDAVVPNPKDVLPTAEELESEDTSVEGETRKKIQSLRRSLYNDMAMRDEVSATYDAEIAKLEAANDGSVEARRKIANLKAVRADALSKYDERIDNTVDKIERMHSKPYQRAQARKRKGESYFEMFKSLLGNTKGWKDRRFGIQNTINTLHRNLRYAVRDVDGKKNIKLADEIYDILQGNQGYSHNEALLNKEKNILKKPFTDLNLNKAERVYAQMLGEFRHNPNTQLEEADVQAYYNEHAKKINVQNVDEAIKQTRKLYDDLFVRVNEVLREHGFKEIPYKKGYFPHFEAPKQGWFARLMNWKVKDDSVPTSIAGLTENFNPERSYQSFNKERKTDKTDYDLYQGLDTYINGALDWIYHIEDLQKRRAFEDYLRYVRSDDGVKERIKAIKNDDSLDADEARQQINAVYDEAESGLANFVTDIRRGTNILAGKKNSLDREMEYQTNRKMYSIMTNVSNRITANAVVGSISSALTNIIPITQSWVEVSPVQTAVAMGETLKSIFKDDGTIAKSDFLTNRLRPGEDLIRSGWDKIGDKVGFLMTGIDYVTAQTVWRSKYNTNIAEGMSEAEAIKNADNFCKGLMADRSRGDIPTAFDAKNPLAKIFTAFQLEVANQYGYMFEDAPIAVKNKVSRLAWGYTKAFIGAYTYNALMTTIAGTTPALDPIRAIVELLQDLGVFEDEDDEDEFYRIAQDLGLLKRGSADNVSEAVANLAENVVQEVPFLGSYFGGGRIPIASSLPYGLSVSDLIKDIENRNGKNIAKEFMNSLFYLLPNVGGGQLRKTVQGVGMFLGDKKITGSYTDAGKLRYPVEATPGNVAQAALFGQYASKNAREYFDKKKSPLNDKQLEEFLDSKMPISKYWDYREKLKGLNTAGEKADYIDSLDVPLGTKNLLVNNALNRKTPFSMKDYDKYGSYEEAKLAQEYPEKYALISNVFNYDDWQLYSEVMGKIKGDFRKDRVARYIESLPLSAIKKKILFKSQFNGYHDYDYDIVQYIMGLDISKAERDKIALALGFKDKEAK